MAPPSRRPARRPFSAAGRPRGSPAAGPSHPARWWAGGGGWTAHSAPGKDQPPRVRETVGRAVGPPPRTTGRRKALAGRGRRGARRAEAASVGTRRRSHGGLWPRRSDTRRARRWQARKTAGIGRAPPMEETAGLAVRQPDSTDPQGRGAEERAQAEAAAAPAVQRRRVWGRAGGPTAARPPRSDRSRSTRFQVRVAVEIGRSSTLRDTTDLARGP